MRQLLRGIILALIAGVACAAPLLAAPDRINDDVPDAIPDSEGAWAASYGLESMHVDGPLEAERTAHHFFKLRYTWSPKVSTSFRLTQHDLAGNLGLYTPLFDNQDGGQSYTFDLGVNLLNVARVEANEAAQIAFAAGSSFNLGVSGTQYQLSAAELDRGETLLKAYLSYSTDLTEELRAHTYFSTGRLSGDTHAGSVNRVGAGLDYALSSGCRPLMLMANGVLDVYSFRKPTFTTGRISRFDLGLRYRLAREWFASLGWVTLNDSEHDASGSGWFAGVNFVEEPCPPCATCMPGYDEATAPPAETPPAEAPPVETAATSAEGAQARTEVPAADSEQTGEGSQPGGVAIPVFAAIPPLHTPAEAVMLRAGIDAAPGVSLPALPQLVPAPVPADQTGGAVEVSTVPAGSVSVGG